MLVDLNKLPCSKERTHRMSLSGWCNLCGATDMQILQGELAPILRVLRSGRLEELWLAVQALLDADDASGGGPPDPPRPEPQVTTSPPVA